MGSSDGAEISELVGLLMLNKLVHLFQDDSVGLYRDDGLGVLRDYSGPETERLRKNVVNLNVIFHLQNNSYKPYRKPDNLPVFIHKHSNHPPTILNELRKSISKRISDLSSSKNMFHDAIPVYKEALRKRGFTSDLDYTPKQID